MRLVFGSDHGGVELKDRLVAWAKERGIDVVDVGTHGNASVDYPSYGERAARMVATGQADRGVLVCGSGIGMSIVANKIPGIRAALVSDVENAVLARQHNNANVLCLGGRMIAFARACAMVSGWLDAEFEVRHQHRLDLISRLECGEHTGGPA